MRMIFIQNSSDYCLREPKRDESAFFCHRMPGLLCRLLRGEAVSWPPEHDAEFYRTFLEQAKQEGIDGLLCQLLKPSPAWNSLPDQVRVSLTATLRSQAAVEMLRREDLLALLHRLEQSDIPVLVFKGAAISATHYPDPCLRPRCDTDLFFSCRDIVRMRQLFTDLGYRCQGPFYKSHQFTCSKRTAHGLLITYDLHWRLNNTSGFARILSWEEARRNAVPIPGLPKAHTLRPEHALLITCLHRAGNPEQERLISLYDIHLLVSAMAESDLIRFAEKAVEKNIQQFCLPELLRAQDCFAAEVPESVLHLLATPSRACSGYAVPRNFTRSYLALIVDDLRCLPDIQSRLSLLRELLLPGREELLGKYGGEELSGQKRASFLLLYFRYIVQGLIKRLVLFR